MLVGGRGRKGDDIRLTRVTRLTTRMPRVTRLTTKAEPEKKRF